MRLFTTKRFARDLKRMQKRGKDMVRLESVVKALLAGDTLPPRYRAHALGGQWKGFRECHLEPDWLLLWKRDEDALTLVRTGSHSDLF